MDCHHATKVAESFLAGEHAVPPEVLHHLRTCDICREELDRRQRLREAMKAAFGRAESLQVRPEFVASLRADLYRRAHQRPPARWRWVPAALLAAAAMCVLAIGFSAREVIADRQFAALVRDAAGDHQACAVNYRPDQQHMSLGEAGRRVAPFYSALNSVAPQPSRAEADEVIVVARHACTFKGRRFAHIIVRYRGEIGSVLVAADPAGRTRTPEVLHVNGLNLVSFAADNRAVFVVCPLNEGESRELAAAFEQPITEALAGF